MCTNLQTAWIVPQGVVSRQGRDGKINQVQTTRGQLVCTNLQSAWIVPQGVVSQGRDGKINVPQCGFQEEMGTTRGQLVCTNLLAAWIVPQDVVCRQGKRWENQSSSGNKEVSECAQTYRLHRLCHRVLFPGKD